MKTLIDTRERKAKITRSFIFLFLLLSIILILFVLYSQNKYFKYDAKLYQNFTSRVLKQIQERTIQHYKDVLYEILLDDTLKHNISLGKREAVYKILKPKYVLLQKQNPFIDVMQIIKSDGTSFLRIHNPRKYGDRLDNKRKMVKNSITNQKFVEGFESGIYANSYRLMMPIYIDGKYIASIEIGINPDYFVLTAKRILDERGYLFIKKQNLVLHHNFMKFHIGEYYLQSDTYEKDDKLLKLFPTKIKLIPRFEVNFEGKTYILHMNSIKKYGGGEYGKFIFLEDITQSKNYQNEIRMYGFVLFVLFLASIIFLINYYMAEISVQLHEVYERFTNELTQRETYLTTLLNSLPNITISLIEREMESVNDKFYDFTGFSSLEEFKKKYKCICDLFVPRQGYLSAYIENEYWMDYIIARPDMDHFAILKKDDNEYIFRVFSSIVDFDEKQRYFIIFADVTEILRVKDELEKNQKLLIAQSKQAAMGEMINMIAHQWRQPLSVISMAASNIVIDIELDINDKNALKEESKEIINEINFLSQTIDDFRNFFKTDKKVEKVKISEILDKAIRLVEKQFISRSIEIIHNFQDEKNITTYSRELIQVFLSILNNSKEAYEEIKDIKKVIKIEIRGYDNRVSIVITDNAGGVKEDMVERIFEPYFSTKEKKNGSGLGLYMSKTIIEKHLQGTIKAYNYGNGISLEIVLPLFFGSWDRRSGKR
ncbi:MAG: GHKL domain-containing protein [Epsilonproteobacteria bacterium]|nr:GHKL domain-containing protein [Campylobacterota bacterium]